MYIFLSHASKEHNKAAEVCRLLEERGHQCFLAPRDIRTGHEYAEEIIDGIERAEVMLLLLSEAANESPHVLREIERAVSKKIRIVVYQLEKIKLSKSMEYFLMSHQWINTDVDAGYEEIVKRIEELAKSEQVPETVKPKKKASAMLSLKKNIRWLFALAVIVFAAVLVVNLVKKQEDAEIPDNKLSPTKTQKAELGDTVLFGTYGGEPIQWRVLKLNEDGTAVLISSHILTMKAYDAAESGKYNTMDGKNYWMDSVKELGAEQQTKLRGCSSWDTSNIRSWLNSEKENVSYADQAPTAKAMSELVNGYDAEPGFLNGFSKAEREAIVPTKTITNGKISEDKVFLLSKEELIWFNTADVSKMAVPTEYAITKDDTGWYQIFALDYGVEDYYWWLRNAVESEEGFSACEVWLVANSYADGQLISKSAGLEGFGIRPAVTVNLSAECIVVEPED